jgi:hypothetical protein
LAPPPLGEHGDGLPNPWRIPQIAAPPGSGLAARFERNLVAFARGPKPLRFAPLDHLLLVEPLWAEPRGQPVTVALCTTAERRSATTVPAESLAR